MIVWRKSRGFTLIEMMIAFAILAVLAGIAYTSYNDQVLRSNRADAKSALNDASQRLQRCFTLYSDFTHEDCQVHDDLTGGGIESTEGLYEVDFDGAATATTYTLRATPVRAPQTNDTDCSGANRMTLTHTGRREPEDCW